MKPFISQLIFFFAVFLLSSLLLVFTVNRLIAAGDHFSLDAGAKYLIMGNSHANCSFNDSLIAGSVNCAQGGEPYLFTYLKTKKLITENKQITTVFVEFSNNQISQRANKWTWENASLTNYYPLYAPFINFDDFKLLCTKNIKCVITAQPVSLKKNIGYIFENKNFITNGRWGGYHNYKGTSIDPKPEKIPRWHIDYDVKDTSISEVNVNYLVKIVAFLKQHHINVILVRSPVPPSHSFLKNELRFRQVLATTFKDVVFLDFVDLPLYNKEYGDFEHLNYQGAKTFSVFFNTLIKNGLLQSKQKQAIINEAILKLRTERTES